MKKNFQWRINLPGLLKEIIESNNGMGIFEKPINIFVFILKEVADRASVINDIELNKLMLRLSLYDISNPESETYDPKFVTEYLENQK